MGRGFFEVLILRRGGLLFWECFRVMFDDFWVWR